MLGENSKTSLMPAKEIIFIMVLIKQILPEP